MKMKKLQSMDKISAIISDHKLQKKIAMDKLIIQNRSASKDFTEQEEGSHDYDSVTGLGSPLRNSPTPAQLQNSVIPNFIDVIFMKDKRKNSKQYDPNKTSTASISQFMAQQSSVGFTSVSPSNFEAIPEQNDGAEDDHPSEETIQMLNEKQFKVVSQLFDDYYNNHEPVHEKYEAIKELKKRLKRNIVLNVNVIENEHIKIKKENMGKGAQLNNSMRTDDPSMMSFNRLVFKTLQLPDKDDKFMAMKLKRSQIKTKQIEEAAKAKRKKMRDGQSSSDEGNESDHIRRMRTTAAKMADDAIDVLQIQLSRLLSDSPEVHKVMRKANILKP